MFASARDDVEDTIKLITIDVAADDVYDIVHLHRPSRQGIIVEVTAADRLPTVPLRRSKFAKLVYIAEKRNLCKVVGPAPKIDTCRSKG